MFFPVVWLLGLCGVYDGNKNNDMAMPVTGNQAGKVAHFIKGWRLVTLIYTVYNLILKCGYFKASRLISEQCV